MNGPAIFLTAEWRNLLMLNYAVDPSLLRQTVPAGTELDTFDGKTYLSLVGFEFNRTRVRGFSILFHRSFEEVNLRFYVRRGPRRGVVFLRELVPRFAVAAVARIVYREKYLSVPMQHAVSEDFDASTVVVRYSWGNGGGHCAMQMASNKPAYEPSDGSLAQFITEHYWGYAAQRDGDCLEYEVQHPRWRVREATTVKYSGDAAKYYGREFAQLLRKSPDSAFLAAGSPVTVFKGMKIR